MYNIITVKADVLELEEILASSLEQLDSGDETLESGESEFY